MIEERTKISDIYQIKDGIIYYFYSNTEVYTREVCPEIVELLTQRRRVRIGNERKCRFLTVIYENELKSINCYILGWDQKFTMQAPYPKGEEIIRGFGKVEIITKGKKL